MPLETVFVEGNPLDALVFATLIVGGLVVLITRRRRVSTFLRANGPLLVFLLYCVLSVLWSDYPEVAFKRWIKAIGDTVMVLIVLTDPEPTAAIKRLLARAGFLLIPPSILLIKYYPSLGRGYSPWTGEAYNNGVALHKNGLGYIALIFGLGSLWYLLEALLGGKRPRATGPLIAIALLQGLHVPMRTVFMIAVIPGAIGVVLLIAFLKEERRRAAVSRHPGSAAARADRPES